MKKKTPALFLALVLMLSCLPVQAFADTYGKADNARNAVARIIAKGNVYICDEKGNRIAALEENTNLFSGSCFAVGERGKPVTYFVTNHHVVERESEYEIAEVQGVGKVLLEYVSTDFYLTMDNEVTLHPLTIVADNTSGADLAVVALREPTTRREACVLAPYQNAEKLRGEEVRSMGFPGAMEGFLDPKQSLASGVDQISTRDGKIDHEVKATQSDGHGTILLTDTPMSHGNSGGPLVDKKGGVLGVCVMGSQVDQNMNAAVSVNEVVSLLNRYNIPYVTEDDVVTWPMRVLLIGAGVLLTAAVILLVQRFSKDSKKKGKSLYRLQGLTGVYAGKRFAISKDLRIGRDATRNDLVYPENYKKISGSHCVILLRNNELYIQDSGSKNGTFVNDQRLSAGLAKKLAVGDIISLVDRENSFKIDISHSK